ncbi:tax1-binding protein 1 homolog isoform X2 [Portunus trituberculatus]|nr:tax1-binding protein 1 homolog isoform X2 [Portunus trituberculatus]XP_045108895.1 tax1-binding protein 1 homolog isoform X2 [Portunus trituberculatus]
MTTTPTPLSITTSTTTTATTQREMDEVSIASDFSIIPESMVEIEGAAGGGHCPTRTVSTGSFLHSEDLQPSLSALETHAKVSFSNIHPTYCSDTDVAVTYSLTPAVIPRSSDRVGLYRVGFTSPQEYLSYQWAPAPPQDLQPGLAPSLTVVFRAPSLPKEIDEFYQFCYVTHEGQIAGVSAPFQLVGVSAASDVCGVEEDGMVVVRSGESVLHQRINELVVMKDKLVGECEVVRGEREEMSKQLEEKTQQLNMCQHHLQAIEVKMKRVTAEKCELMGRVGQVVEDKGHLEDRLKTLDRSITAERTRADTAEAKVKELEEATLTSRKSLEKTIHSLRATEDQLSLTKEALKATKAELQEEQAGREKAVHELAIWTDTAQADLSEKNSLTAKFNSVSAELTAKMEEMEATRRKVFSLEEKLKEALEELEGVKGAQESAETKVAALEREKAVLTERQEALGLDNTRLQAANTALKEHVSALQHQQEREMKGREAAETIASDLSGRLQAARTEYTTLAVINKRLMRKLKKMRSRMESTPGGSNTNKAGNDSVMTTSITTTSSWLQLEEEEEVEEEGERVEEEAPSVLSQSCLSQPLTASCCSHSTQQLSEVVNKKMEDIVKELSQQILSLKCQLEEKERRSEEKKEEEEEEEEDTPQHATGTATDSPPQVLYSNSFLKTATTAPVFLPEGLNTTAAATTTPHSTTNTTHSTTETTTTTTNTTQRVNYHYQIATPPQPTTAGFLPPPLLPETTSTARHAAVMGQFATAPTAPPHDSDDDDFHSTDSDSSPAVTLTSAVTSAAVLGPHPPPVTSQPQPLPQNLPQLSSDNSMDPPSHSTPSLSVVQCPLCSLVFPQESARLLEEHVNSHLEHVCPVCSKVFQRNCQERFQAHVQEHFKEEEEEEEERRLEEEDSSGPWGRHLRNAHLLEID